MNQPVSSVRQADIHTELRDILLPELEVCLQEREDGHCMRVGVLDLPLMVALCKELRKRHPSRQIHILDDGNLINGDVKFGISSTKLVELRNPLPDGTQRPPLLVFVPPGMRTSAEDSFGEATFEILDLGDVYGKLVAALKEQLPRQVRQPVHDLEQLLSEQRWEWYNAYRMARYLLALKRRDFDPQMVGWSLYELGLVPDEDLMKEPTTAYTRLGRNLECVRRVVQSTRSPMSRALELELDDLEFIRGLGRFFQRSSPEAPLKWTRQIALDKDYWFLSFGKWSFEQEAEVSVPLSVELVDLTVPTIPADTSDTKLQELLGQRVLVLGKKGLRSFKVTLCCDPAPQNVPGVAYFVVQVVSTKSGPINFSRKKSVWRTNRTSAAITFNKLNKADWEDGWHYLRVLAYSEDGDLHPLADSNGEDVPFMPSHEEGVPSEFPHISEPFYVLHDEEAEVEPVKVTSRSADSFQHALWELQFSALNQERSLDSVQCTELSWATGKKSSTRKTDTLECRFGTDGLFKVTVSERLKALEQHILQEPQGPLAWRLEINLEGVEDHAPADTALWPTSLPGIGAFLETRAAYFAAVLQNEAGLITQAAELGSEGLFGLVLDYAMGYLRLLGLLREQAAQASPGRERTELLRHLRRLIGLDQVLVTVTDHRGYQREAALLGPTHPLRALWLGSWSRLGREWLARCVDMDASMLRVVQDGLLSELSLLHVPVTLPVAGSRLLAPLDNIHPYWTLYTPASETDPRGLIGDISHALGLPEPNFNGTAINGAYLAQRVKRYLIQHPYIRVLQINALGAGHAQILVDVLLELQREEAFSDLRYDIRLFAHDPESPTVGQALLELLSPSSSVTAQEADAFARPAANPLFPKLAMAVLSIEDFGRAASNYPAHITMLFDVFPPENIGAAPPFRGVDFAPVHGLAQSFSTRYQDEEGRVMWQIQPRHGKASPLDETHGTEVLTALSEQLSGATAMVATGQVEGELSLRPVLGLALNSSERALLHQVHEVSDWVFTVDRHLGIEFFDHGQSSERPDYLIDHSPEESRRVGHRMVITARSTEEVEQLLQPVLQKYSLPARGEHAAKMFNQLRKLSGRLALKLISSPTQRNEALGLALARLFLLAQGALKDQLVVPLDAHLDLYKAPQKQAEELGDSTNFKRTDLALFDLDARERVVRCNLVEVKCYTSVGDFSALQALQEHITKQLQQTEKVLRHHFDTLLTTPDRPDRFLKSRQLAQLLEFYLDRSVRYGLLDDEAAKEAQFCLDALEEGYRLAFTHSALIFDLDFDGVALPEEEHGITFHRLGTKVIQALIAPAEEEEPSSLLDESSTPAPEAPAESYIVPSLENAAFLSRPRDRSVPLSLPSSEHKPSLAFASTMTAPNAVEPEPVVPVPPEQVESLEAGLEVQPELPLPARTVTVEEDLPVLSQESQEEEEVLVEEKLVVERVQAPEPAQEEPVVQQEPPAQDKSPEESFPEVTPAVFLGSSSASEQFGILGEAAGRKIALDLNQTHTISLFGVQGGGKSYTLGTIAEMASLPIPHVNQLPKPLATVIFHYSATMDYKPEFTSMVEPNSEEEQLTLLRERYGAEPKALADVALLTPADKLEERRAEYPGIEVYPLKFAASELQVSHWLFLMGAVGNQAAYIRQLKRMMKKHRYNLTLEVLRKGVENSRLADHLKSMANMRLDFAADYIDDTNSLSHLIRPGRLLIVDLRDEYIEKDEALGLFVVLLQLFADASFEGQEFNKLVVFDEAHKYIDSPDLVAGLVEVVREMRHKGTSIMVASQDPPSVPVSLIELSTHIILHKFNSPAWLKHIQKANAALGTLTPERMAHLRPGEAYVWSSKATDEAFSKGTIKIKCRPRVTQHGGATKTALR